MDTQPTFGYIDIFLEISFSTWTNHSISGIKPGRKIWNKFPKTKVKEY